MRAQASRGPEITCGPRSCSRWGFWCCQRAPEFRSKLNLQLKISARSVTTSTLSLMLLARKQDALFSPLINHSISSHLATIPEWSGSPGRHSGRIWCSLPFCPCGQVGGGQPVSILKSSRAYFSCPPPPFFLSPFLFRFSYIHTLSPFHE